MYFASGNDDGPSPQLWGRRSDLPSAELVQTVPELAERLRELALTALREAERAIAPETIDALQLALLLAERTLEGHAAFEAACMRRDGRAWNITFSGQEIRLRDSLGLGYLRQLLARPGERVHSVILAVGLDAAGIDGTAAKRNWLADRIENARERLDALQEGLEQATWQQDEGFAATVRAGIDEATQELLEALGYSDGDGSARRFVERARLNVSRALGVALNRIQRHHRPLAAHLRSTIRTGAFCAYIPDPRAPIRWRV